MSPEELVQLDIYNLALRHLGMNKVASLTGTDPSTRVMNDFWLVCRDAVFSGHQWQFANSRILLDEYSGTVPSGWFFAYDYPTLNAATIWNVFNDGTVDKKEQQEFETMYLPDAGKQIILSNNDEASAEYTYIIEDATQWDANFKLALSYYLSASACTLLTGDMDKASKLMIVYGNFMADTKRVDSFMKMKTYKPQSGYQQSRG